MSFVTKMIVSASISLIAMSALMAANMSVVDVQKPSVGSLAQSENDSLCKEQNTTLSGDLF